MSSWKYSEEEMPDQLDADCTADVLVWYAPGQVCSGFFSRDDFAWYDADGDIIFEGHTYWMAHPDDPE